MPKPLKILDAQTVIKKTPKNTSQQKPRYWPCWRHSSCLPGSCYSPAKPDWTGLHGSRGRSRGSFARHVHWPCCRDRWSDSHARDSHARDSHARDDLGCHHLHLGKGWGFQGFGPKGHELAGKMMFLTFASGFWSFPIICRPPNRRWRSWHLVGGMILEVLPAGRSRCAFVPRYFSRKSLMTMKGTQIGCSFLFKFGPSATFLEVERSNLLPVNKHSDGNPGFHDDLHSWWILHSFSVFTGWYPLIFQG